MGRRRMGEEEKEEEDGGGGEEGNEERASGLWPMDEKTSGSFFTAPKFARELLGPRHFYKL